MPAGTSVTRSPRGLVVSVLVLTLILTGCGQSHNRPTRRYASSAVTADTYLNDGDNDPTGDADGDSTGENPIDNDNDYPEDHLNPRNASYHDTDDDSLDGGPLSYGRPANVTETQTIVPLVKRYYTLAVADDAVQACSMLDATLAASLPEDYGRGAGPPYLRGAKTCTAVLRLLFERFHSVFDNSPVVTSVRIHGDQAIAFIGSPTMPASSIMLVREGDAWKLDATIGSPLR
jgi:hypothetical protein